MVFLLRVSLIKEQEEGNWQSENLLFLPKNIEKNAVVWVDAQDPTEPEWKELETYFGFGENSLQEVSQELLEEGFRSRIDAREEQVFCFLKFPNRKNFLAEAKMERLAILFCPKWIITLHTGYSELSSTVFKKNRYIWLSLALIHAIN